MTDLWMVFVVGTTAMAASRALAIVANHLAELGSLPQALRNPGIVATLDRADPEDYERRVRMIEHEKELSEWDAELRRQRSDELDETLARATGLPIYVITDTFVADAPPRPTPPPLREIRE